MFSSSICKPRVRALQFCCTVTIVCAFVAQIQNPSRKLWCEMVRNIDLPEALILYGSPIIFDEERSSWRTGIDELVDQCKADDAAVILLVENGAKIQDEIKEKLLFPSGNLQFSLTETVMPPNPSDLLRAIEAVTIQPKGFGGSSGFGRRQLLDPERNPLPQRTVVLTHTLDQTRAARYAGMRAIRLMINSNENDHLADLVTGDTVDFNIDDISTPGSFWLNPPHPRDDNGNRVDPCHIDATLRMNKNLVLAEDPTSGDELSNEDLQRILADIDPL